MRASTRKRNSAQPLAKPACGVLALSVALAFPQSALALPTGEAVVNGSVAVTRPSAQQMVVEQGSDKAIVNWQGFSIGGAEGVAFQQPGAASVILNRVVGGDPSSILGRMTANGKVFLVNPGGVFFAPGASVDVGGLVASTLSISNDDFLAGRYRFAAGGSAGGISNQGTLRAADGGTVALLGGQVSNDGTITAKLGTVALAAGKRISLDFAGDGLTKVTVDEAAVGAQVRNSGMIIADGGQAVLTAHAAQALTDTVVNQTGVVRARSLAQRNGRIMLDGGDEGVTQVSGTLDASGQVAGETGGEIQVLGHDVGIVDQAKIDASGDAGGGTVLVGGDYQGKNPLVRNAAATYFGPDATINADAISNGHGGKVILWGNDTTQAYGSISARGGAQSGNGGFVETSGHWLDVAGARVSASAIGGTAGTWLLDPSNITIEHSTSPVTPIPTGLFVPDTSPATVSDFDINRTLNAGTNVTIRAEAGGFSAPIEGNIIVNGTSDAGGAVSIANTVGGRRSVSLLADGRIEVHDGAAIGAAGAGNSLSLNLSAGNSGIGIVGANILTNGGDVTMFGHGGGGTTGSLGGILIESSTIDAGGGDVSLRGRGENFGVRLGCGGDGCDTVITTSGANGSIAISGQSTAGGAGIEAGSDVRIGGEQTNGNIVLRAASSGGDGGDSIVLDAGGSASIRTSGAINLRPGGVSTAGTLTEFPATEIDVSDTSGRATFSLSPGDLAAIQPGYSTLVIGSDQHYGPIYLRSAATFSGNVTLQNTGASAGPSGIQLYAPLTSGGTAVLASSGEIWQDNGLGGEGSADSPITAPNLLVHATNPSADVILNSASNLVGTFAADPPATVTFVNNGPLVIGTLSGTGFSAAANAPQSIVVTDSSAVGRFFVQAAGNLTLNQTISTSGPNPSSDPNIELVTGGIFTNNAVPLALAPVSGGIWRIWADTWVGENRGGLAPGNAQPNLYGCTYPGSCTAGVLVPTDGNHFIYRQRPSVTVVADDKLKSFGTANPPLTSSAFGLVNGDTADGALTGSLTTTAVQLSPIGLYPITQATPYSSPVGYNVTFAQGQLGVQGIPDQGEKKVPGLDGTYLYDRNIGLPHMCVATGPLAVQTAMQGADLLDVEWSRVRQKPNVTNCIALGERYTCDSF